jgi:flagellar operon protein
MEARNSGGVEMKIQNSGLPSINQLTDQYLKGKQNNTSVHGTREGISFEEILKSRQQIKTSVVNEEVKFSKHASMRLNDRNIELSEEQLERLNDGTQKASEKGINESLVLVDDLAFIVNVKNNTVVTAMDQTETKKNIFTNIDGAVIA